MKKDFSYLLPDELFVDSFLLNKKFSATYDGPSTVKVLINKNTGELSGIEPESYNQDYYELIEIDASENPEISYFILNSSDSHEYQYEEEIMINGDIYQKVLNPTIHDAYTIYFDLSKRIFQLNLIVKTSENNFITNNLSTLKNRLNFILMNEEKKEQNQPLDVSETTINLISNFIKEIDNEIEKNSIFMDWKYTNFDNILDCILTIPEDIKNLLNTYQ